GYAGSQTLVERWNGTAWSVVPSPNPGTSSNELYGVAAVSANDVWAVGRYYNGTAYRTLVEHWDGTAWSVVDSLNLGTYDNELYDVAVVSANDVWVVGAYLVSRNGYYPAQTLVEHWDGSAWSVVPSIDRGVFSNHLMGVVALSSGDL